MAYKKNQITIWTDGRIDRTGRGLVDRDLLEQDMTHTRERYANRPEVLSIEETATTIVVVKESGVVHVYVWTL